MKKIWGCLLVTTLLITLTGCQEKKKLTLKQEEFTIELGENPSQQIEEYLDLTTIKEEDKTSLLEQVTLTFNIDEEAKVTKEEKSYIKTGTYTGTITYEKEIVEFIVQVKDTVAPVITGLESIQLPIGQEFAYKDYYSVTDLNDLEEIQLDTSAIDINTAGEYKLMVTVKDKAGNAANKEVPVTVLAVAETQEATSEVITTEDGKQSYVTTVTDKPVEVVEAPANNASTNNDETPSYSGGNTTATSPQQPTYQEPTAPSTPDTGSSDRTEAVCTPVAGNSNEFFDTWDEADAYGLAQRRASPGTIRGYASGSAGCGKWTVNFTYK